MSSKIISAKDQIVAPPSTGLARSSDSPSSSASAADSATPLATNGTNGRSKAANLDGTGTSVAAALLASALQKFWGYSSFRPLQLEAMQSVMSDCDSLVLFPTGGGKSLCFQAPAVCRDGLAVVVSPLISLMKDQVDALNACGIRAAYLNSSISPSHEREVLADIRNGSLKIVYLAPERLLTDRTLELLSTVKLSLFAIDEAHCVSEWGHDFRPEYRGLSVLKRRFPEVSIHAYTATATETVRADIIRQLGFTNANVLVGSMDRPNLNYQMRRRQPGMGQILEVLNERKSESGIIYCISRKDVESTSAALNALGFFCLPYHAGLSAETRKQNQDSFLKEQCKIMVATVAFGMGIDKSNVRFVIHAAMPKSLEAYQQESGRAGRDGLDADCWLFHTAGDIVSWKRLVTESSSGVGLDAALAAISAVANFCNGQRCRHVALAAHFGESLAVSNCGACDICLSSNQADLVEDSVVLGQKIVSCVHRVEQRFGAEYVAQILTASSDQRILENGHDKLSTYGLLKSEHKKSVRHWIEELVGQNFLEKSGEFNVLKITYLGKQLLRGGAKPRLTKNTPSPITDQFRSGPSSSKANVISWEGVDRPLFEMLVKRRAEIAQQQNLPTHVVFSDHTLRDMARRRPSTLDAMYLISGVGKQKLEDFGNLFLSIISQQCKATGLAGDVKPIAAFARPVTTSAGPSKSALGAFPLFDQGLSISEVAAKLARAESTTGGYLSEYIRYHRITDATRWVDLDTIAKVKMAIDAVGAEAMKPIHVFLEEEIGYDKIKIVLECLANQSGEES